MYTHQLLVEYENKGKNANAAATETVDGRVWVAKTIPQVCARIDEHCHCTFAPFMATRYVSLTPDTVIGNDLRLPEPLLSLTSLTVESTVKTQWTGTGSRSAYDFMLPRDGAPYDRIIGLQVDTWLVSEGYYDDVIAVAGAWGYRKHFPGAGWKTVPDVTVTIADTTGLTFTTSTTSALSPGMLAKCEDEVFMIATVPNTTSFTVLDRGGEFARGTTAAAHAGKAISVWEPEPAVARAATVWLTQLYVKRGVVEQFRIDTPTGVIKQFEPDMPAEVAALLAPYVRRVSGAV